MHKKTSQLSFGCLKIIPNHTSTQWAPPPEPTKLFLLLIHSPPAPSHCFSEFFAMVSIQPSLLISRQISSDSLCYLHKKQNEASYKYFIQPTSEQSVVHCVSVCSHTLPSPPSRSISFLRNNIQQIDIIIQKKIKFTGRHYIFAQKTVSKGFMLAKIVEIISFKRFWGKLRCLQR